MSIDKFIKQIKKKVKGSPKCQRLLLQKLGPCVQIIDVMKKVMRPLNVVLGISTIALPIWIIFPLSGPTVEVWAMFKLVLHAIFTGFLGLLLLAGEIRQLTFIQENCKFLIIFMGRGLYNIFCGRMVICKRRFVCNNYSFWYPHIGSPAL